MPRRALPLLALTAPALALATPDVALVTLVAPTSTFTSAPVVFQLVLRNDGTDTGPFTTTFRASTDTTFHGADPFLCELTGTTLTAGQQRVLAVSCTWPDATVTPSGSWYVVARTAVGLTDADPSDDEGSAGPVQVVGTGGTGAPDLRPLTLTPPTSARPGATVSLDYALTNEGAAGAGPSTTRLWLSADALQDPSDAVLCTDGVGALAAGASASRTASGCVVPAAWPVGPAYLVLRVDALGVVSESDESDNDLAAPITLTGAPSARPDLVIDQLQAPSTAPAGQAIAATLTVRNAGAASAPASSVEVRLATTPAFGPGLTVCTGAVSPLPASSSTTVSLPSCAIPTSSPAAAGFLVARVDPAGSVDEADEGNNDASSALTVTSTGAPTPIPTPTPTPGDPTGETAAPRDTDRAPDTDDVAEDTDDTDTGPPLPTGRFGCACTSGPPSLGGTLPWALLLVLPRRRTPHPRR